MITGVRAAESIQRLQYMAALNMGAKKGITGTNTIYPIYDWKTPDVGSTSGSAGGGAGSLPADVQVGVNRNRWGFAIPSLSIPSPSWCIR